MRTFSFILFITLLIQSSASYGKDVILIKDEGKPRAEKEAILILNGLGKSGKGTRHQKRFFRQFKYDLFIPDYIQRKSFSESQKELANFFEEQHLSEYESIHIVSFILGAWSFNPYILANGEMNIKTFIYDRSPTQERAPQVVDEKIPLLGRMASGKVLRDFKGTPYPTIKNGDINIGIILESKATLLMRTFEDHTLSLGPLEYENPELNQDYDDLMYTYLDHKQMYISFDVIGADIMHFIEHGKFSEDARRQHYNWDPFVPYRKEKRKK